MSWGGHNLGQEAFATGGRCGGRAAILSRDRAGRSRSGDSRRHVPPSQRRRREVIMAKALSENESALIDAYWRAANYLSVGQIYLFDNPLLKVPLLENHVKPRLLG